MTETAALTPATRDHLLGILFGYGSETDPVLSTDFAIQALLSIISGLDQAVFHGRQDLRLQLIARWRLGLVDGRVHTYAEIMATLLMTKPAVMNREASAYRLIRKEWTRRRKIA